VISPVADPNLAQGATGGFGNTQLAGSGVGISTTNY